MCTVIFNSLLNHRLQDSVQQRACLFPSAPAAAPAFLRFLVPVERKVLGAKDQKHLCSVAGAVLLRFEFEPKDNACAAISLRMLIMLADIRSICRLLLTFAQPKATRCTACQRLHARGARYILQPRFGFVINDAGSSWIGD